MRIAICAPFMQSDLWQERVRRLVPGKRLEFEEFYDPDGLRQAPTFHYDALIVAMGGEIGSEMAEIARKREQHAPLLWLSDDDHDGLMAYKLHAGMFLMLGCTDQELLDGLNRCGISEEDRQQSI